MPSPDPMVDIPRRRAAVLRCEVEERANALAVAAVAGGDVRLRSIRRARQVVVGPPRRPP